MADLVKCSNKNIFIVSVAVWLYPASELWFSKGGKAQKVRTHNLSSDDWNFCWKANSALSDYHGLRCSQGDSTCFLRIWRSDIKSQMRDVITSTWVWVSSFCCVTQLETSEDHLTWGKHVTWWVVVENCAFKLGQCKQSAFTHNTNPCSPANAMRTCLISPPPETSCRGRLFFLRKVVNVTHNARNLLWWRKRFIHMPVIESPQKRKNWWDGIHLCVQECLSV